MDEDEARARRIRERQAAYFTPQEQTEYEVDWRSLSYFTYALFAVIAVLAVLNLLIIQAITS